MNRKEKSPARPDNRQASSGSTITEPGSVAVMQDLPCPTWCDRDHLVGNEAPPFHHDSRARHLQPSGGQANDLTVSTSQYVDEHRTPAPAVVDLDIDGRHAELTPAEARQVGTWLLESASVLEAAAAR